MCILVHSGAKWCAYWCIVSDTGAYWRMHTGVHSGVHSVHTGAKFAYWCIVVHSGVHTGA